ncbi:MAG: Ig-like domain-containing protein, partial [Chloroflexi bacterium]|nr:Ig-like domain-containing protein [Chloroflexota bacterium]
MLKVRIALIIVCAASAALAIHHVAHADAPPPGSDATPRLSNSTALALERLGDTVNEPASAPAASTPLSAYFLTPLFPTAPLSQTPLGTNFQGWSYEDRIPRYFPPDGGVAAGLNHVMQVVNVYYAIYNKYGSPLATDSLVNFFQPALSTLGTYNIVSDPRVLYDAVRGRWLVTLLVINYQTDGSGNGWVVLAVSPGDDPTTAPNLWHQTVITTTRDSGSNRSFGDFDTLGYDSRNVYIGTNQFTFGVQAWRGNDLFVLSRADAYGPPGTSVNQQRFNNVNCLSSAQPVGGDEDPSMGYFVSWSRCSATQFIVQPISGTAPAASLAAQITLNTLNVAQPPQARQLNGPNTIDTIDGRVMNAVYRNGSLWTAHAVSITIGGDGSAVIHWLQINLAAQTIQQEGVYSSTATDYYYPMITVDSRNNALLVFNRSSAMEYISAYYAVRLSSDPPNTFGASSLLKSGVDQYYRYWNASDTRNRWGDYNGVALDPNGHTVWMEAAIAYTRTETATNGSYGNWTTWIGATDLPYPLLTSTVALSSSLNPSLYGQAVTLTARVTSTTGGGAVPTGTLLFKIDSTAMTTTLNALGSASAITSLLSAGSHVVTATYLGNSVYSSTISTPLAQVVNQAGTSVAISATPHPSTFGQSVTVTLRAVSSVAGVTPTGFITLSIDGWSAAIALDAAGSASYVTSTLSGGAHPMTATYGGIANFSGSSASFTQTVNRTASTTRLTAAPNLSTYGETVTFTVQVTSAVPGFTPTGVVTLSAGGADIPLLLDPGGAAVYATSTLSIATHTITATYDGDASYIGSWAGITQTVNRAIAHPGLTVTPTPSTLRQPVTFTLQVTSSVAGITPTGSVTLCIDATELPLQLDSFGGATYVTDSLSIATHAVTMTYDGDSNFSGGATTLTHTVQRAPSVASVAGAPNPAPFNQAVTFTLQVTSGLTGLTPTGAITLSVDGADIALALDAGGGASYVTGTLRGGAHAITATYGGDASYNHSSMTLTQVISRAATTTSLNASPAAVSELGQQVTFTLQVSSSVAGFTSTGAITLSIDGADIALALDTEGGAYYATAALPGGGHAITATYGGDIDFDASAAPLAYTVNQTGTTAGIDALLNPSTYGQTVTFTAHVTSNVAGFTPTGS